MFKAYDNKGLDLGGVIIVSAIIGAIVGCIPALIVMVLC